jgi:uracil DNA glycosylase
MIHDQTEHIIPVHLLMGERHTHKSVQNTGLKINEKSNPSPFSQIRISFLHLIYQTNNNYLHFSKVTC